jgi:hypothetical protein
MGLRRLDLRAHHRRSKATPSCLPYSADLIVAGGESRLGASVCPFLKLNGGSSEEDQRMPD